MHQRFLSRILTLGFGALLSALLSGCATMFARNYDDITIKSDPAGADIYLNLEKIGTTPHTFKMVRKTFEQPAITLRMAGYESSRVPLQRTIEGVSLLNFGFFLSTGGATCWGIDALNGSMIKYAPTGYYVELKRSLDRTTLRSPTMTISPAIFAVQEFQNILIDLSKGDGVYLRSYYEVGNKGISFENFQKTASKNVLFLLSSANGLELHERMEQSLVSNG